MMVIANIMRCNVFTKYKAAQVAQNKMLRMLDRVSLTEHIPSKALREKYDIPSVNQLSAEIKLTESWKSVHIDGYPFQLEPNNPSRDTQGRSIRATTEKKWKDTAKSKAGEMSCSRDAAKLWNNAPLTIKSAKTLSLAKKEIKAYCKTIVD